LPRKTDSNNPEDWIYLAESDLEGLVVLAEKEVAYALCHSKLAEVLEKILKAELIRLGWFLEKTHDLQKLAGELQARNSDLTHRIKPLCNPLAEVYFSARYPGFDMDDPDWPGFRAQLDQVAELHRTVKNRLPNTGNMAT
jgi:HEPN domain-containing protein